MSATIKIKNALRVALLSALFALSAFAQDQAGEGGAPEIVQLDGWDPPPAVIDRSNAVRAEVNQLPDHAWAGAYYQGDGLGMNVRLLVSPTAGVTATWHGCMGLYASNEGLIQPQPDGSLKLKFKMSNNQQSAGFPDDVLPVRWGERRYLIPKNALSDFVSAINLGREPRDGRRGGFLLAEDDELKLADGLPDLPQAWRARIRSEALIVTSTNITLLRRTAHDGWCDATYRVTIPSGADDGLTPGTLLHVSSPEGVFESLRLIGVQRRRAWGELWMSSSECNAIKAPDRSWTFTTGAYAPEAARARLQQAQDHAKKSGDD